MAKIKITNPQQIINGGAKKYYFKVKGLGGPKGDRGEKGDTGSRGPQGEPGNAATVYVGSTTTLPVGQDATVENVGTQYNAVLNFGIPQGPRGPQGIQGERGEPGQTGQTGPRGPQGERGTNATVYIGTTTTLNPGTQATVYNSGTDSNAVLNFGIPRGETGATGATGATGPAGQNFTPTIVDSLPATGNQSNLYLTPKNYTTGTATGNPITISLGEEAGQITSAQLDGNTTQQTYTGKNLLDMSSSTSHGVTGTINADGTITISGKANVTGGFVVARLNTPISAGTYTMSISRALDYVINLSFASGVALKIEAGQTTATVTLSQEYSNTSLFMAMTSGVTYNDTFSIQIVQGSTPDYDFEPYVGGTASPNPDYPQAVNTVTGTQTVSINGTDYPISLGSIELCKISSTYQDYIYKSGNDWKVHKATKKVTLNGSEEWQNSGTNIFACISLTDYAESNNIGFSAVATGISNKPNASTFDQASTNNNFAFGDGTYANRLYWKSTSFANATAFKTWLQSNNIPLYYALATATDTTITDQTLIAQLEAVRNATLEASNTITNTAAGTNLAGDLELDYYEFDPHNRYDKWLWLDINNNYEQLGS